MLAIANIAAEDPGATFPQYRHAGAPDGHHFLIRRYPAASFALAGFAGLATGKTCAACHRFRLTLERFGFCAFVWVPSMQSKKNVTGTPSALLTP
jgi:hypothetical protein